MSENIREHKHCKKCSDVIEYASGYGIGTVDDKIAYELGICKNCILDEGIKSLKRKKIK